MYAAIMSLQMRVSLNTAYQKYTPEVVDESWCKLAWELQVHMQSAVTVHNLLLFSIT